MHRPSLSCLPRRPTVLPLLLAGGALAALYAGCSSGPETMATSGTGGGASSSSSASSASGSMSSSATSSSSSSAASSSSGSGAGGGDAGAAWPTCDAQPAGVPFKTLHDVWKDNPSQPTPVWVPGVFVTAISKAGCQAGVACQLYVQQAEMFADLAAGSQQALKVFVSAATASHFVGLKVGDKVDVYAWAWRYNVMGENELLLQVNSVLPGCAKAVGTGVPQPVTVQLSDLTLSAYEDTVGPLLVKVNTVSGKPQLPDEIFALWNTGVFSDAGVSAIVNLSPYCLPNSVFVGFVQGSVHDFGSVTGVFGLFVLPGNPPTKYKVIYPRSMAEVPVVKVH